MDAKKELLEALNENCHNDFRNAFFLGLICGLQKASFHAHGQCWIRIDETNRLFTEVFEELKKEHGYQIFEVEK